LAAPIQRSAAGVADGWVSPGVVVGLTGISGAVLIALAIGTTGKDPPAPPPAAVAADRTGPPAEPESVRQRTVRVFHAEVEPIQVDALRRVFRGDGPITLDSLDVAGTWIKAVYRQPVGDPPSRTAYVELIHETESRTNAVYADLDGSGRRKPIDPPRAVVLYRNPQTGQEVVLQHPHLNRALKGFEAIPRDERSAAEGVEFLQKFRAAAAPYLGQWYREGDLATCRVRWVIDWRGEILTFEGPGDRSQGIGGIDLHMSDTGELALTVFGSRVRLSQDGRRIDFVDTGERWYRR
jgi:hypothetical protein